MWKRSGVNRSVIGWGVALHRWNGRDAMTKVKKRREYRPVRVPWKWHARSGMQYRLSIPELERASPRRSVELPFFDRKNLRFINLWKKKLFLLALWNPSFPGPSRSFRKYSRGAFHRQRTSDADCRPHLVQLSRRTREEKHRQQSESQSDVTKLVEKVQQLVARQQRKIGRWILELRALRLKTFSLPFLHILGFFNWRLAPC